MGLWLLSALVAGVIAAKLIRHPRLWRTEAPAPAEVLGVWLILTLVVASGLMGLGELLLQRGPIGMALR